MYLSGPLLHAPYNDPHFSNAPSDSVARIASDPYAPFNSFDHSPDPGLPFEPLSLPITSYPQSEDDECVRQYYGTPEYLVDDQHVETNSTPHGELVHEMAALMQSGHYVSTNTSSGAPWDAGDPTAVQFDLPDSSQGVEHLETPEILREATAFDTSPQVGVTPARPPPQRYPHSQPAFGQPTYGYARPQPEHGYRPINPEGYFDHQHSAGAGLSYRTTGQDNSGQNNDEYSMVSQDPGGTSPPVHRQRRRGPPQSYEAWESSSNHDSGLR